jgi:hypothetical protein
LLLLVEPLQDQQARGGQHDHGGQQGSLAHWEGLYACVRAAVCDLRVGSRCSVLGSRFGFWVPRLKNRQPEPRTEHREPRTDCSPRSPQEPFRIRGVE